jgi:hypothetical protein
LPTAKQLFGIKKPQAYFTFEVFKWSHLYYKDSISPTHRTL